MKIGTLQGGSAIDDRGELKFVDGFDFASAGIRRFYHTENHYRGIIRAWHGHKLEAKYIYVVRGTALFGVVDMEDTSKVEQVVLSARDPKILYIPPGKYNGFMSLEEDTIVIYYSTLVFEDAIKDDYREPWNKWNIWEPHYR